LPTVPVNRLPATPCATLPILIFPFASVIGDVITGTVIFTARPLTARHFLLLQNFQNLLQ